MHWQDFPTKSDNSHYTSKVQRQNSLRYNKFINEQSLNMATPIKNSKISSQLLIDSAVSRVKDFKSQSQQKQKQFLKNRVRQISLGNRIPIGKQKIHPQAGVSSKRKNGAPASVYKVVRDIKHLLQNLKVTLQLIKGMFQISLVAWCKGMDQFTKRNNSLIQSNLDRISSVMSGLQSKNEMNSQHIMAESAPSQRLNSVNRSKRLKKKYTLKSIPDANQQLQQDLNFQANQFKRLEFPDLSKKGNRTEQAIPDFQSTQNLAFAHVQMSSNLQKINHGKGFMSNLTITSYPYATHFDPTQSFGGSSNHQQAYYPSALFCNQEKQENNQKKQSFKHRNDQHGHKQQMNSSKHSRKNSGQSIAKRSSSRKKEIDGELDDINNVLLKMKLMIS